MNGINGINGANPYENSKYGTNGNSKEIYKIAQQRYNISLQNLEKAKTIAKNNFGNQDALAKLREAESMHTLAQEMLTKAQEQLN